MGKGKKKDMVNHPPHYMSRLLNCESIDIIEEFTGELDGFGGFCEGNILKYLFRWKDKNGLEDLEKAEWYLHKLIKYEKKSYSKKNKKGGKR